MPKPVSKPSQEEQQSKPLSQRGWFLLLLLPLLPPASLILLWAGFPKLGKGVKALLSILMLAVFVAWLALILSSLAAATGNVGRSLMDKPVQATLPAPTPQPSPTPAAQEGDAPLPSDAAADIPIYQEAPEGVIELVTPEPVRQPAGQPMEPPPEVDLDAGGSQQTQPTQQAQQTQRTYAVNTDEYNMYFHLMDCPYVADIPSHNYREVTTTREDLMFRGFSPCEVCSAGEQ